jgi:beta-mannosidase
VGAVLVETERVAWGVRVEVPGFVAEDDAFVLVPGAPQTIRLWPVVAGATFAGGRVTALNLIGESPIDAPDVAA